MKKRLLVLLVVAAQLGSLDSWAQDSTASTDDTTKVTFFTDLHVWGDMVKPFTQFINDRVQYEFGAGVVLLDHIQLAGSYGISDHLFSEPDAYFNGTYRATGNYWRVGADYIAGQGAKTWIGLRYAQTTFTDRALGTLTSDLWGDYTLDYSRTFTTQWYEIVLGTEAAPFKLNPALEKLKIGWMLRLRAFQNLKQPADVPVYYIPGYGRAVNPFTANLNITLRYRLGK